MVLKDLQKYTESLVKEEMNLGNMIDASLRAIAQDRERESTITTDDDESENESLDPMLAYPEEKELTYEDYEEFEEMKAEEHRKDLEGE